MSIATGSPLRLDWSGRKAEAWSWLPAEEIEPETLQQVHDIGSLDVAVWVAVMPDAHKGYGMPIGCMLATIGAVVPYAVGVDIGCGMIAARTTLGIADVTPERVREALSGIYQRVPVGQPTRTDPKQGSFEALRETFGGFDVTQTIETHHNFAGVESHKGQELLVHRKGAVRTTDATGAGALVTIPGSMQTGSYIGRGKPNAAALDTCSHGAGRKLGRNAVRRANVGVDIQAEMSAQGICLICPEGAAARDESGRAYKDIEDVMTRQRDLVDPVVKLRPLGVVQGRPQTPAFSSPSPTGSGSASSRCPSATGGGGSWASSRGS